MQYSGLSQTGAKTVQERPSEKGMMSTEIMLQGEIRSGRKAETCSRSEIWRGSSLSQVVFENISFHVRMCINDDSSLMQIDVGQVLECQISLSHAGL